VTATSDLLLGESREPALHLVDPGRVGGGEVQLEARMAQQPALDERCLVRGVVVQDEMHLEVSRHFGINAIQKLAELRSTIEVRRSGGFDAAVPIIRSGTGKQLMDNLREEMSRLKRRQVVGLKRDGVLSDRTTRTRTLVFVFSGGLNILVLAWGYRRTAEALMQRDVALRPRCSCRRPGSPGRKSECHGAGPVPEPAHRPRANHAATDTGGVIGAAVDNITAASYGWLQTKGACALLADGTVTVGTSVVASNGTAGAVEAATGAQQIVGFALSGIATTEYGAIFLTL